MDYYDLIQAYVDNTLTQEQRVAFEAEMDRDPELRLTVEQFPTILEAVDAGAQDDARRLVVDVRKNLKDQQRTRMRYLLPRSLRIAAGIIIVVVAGAVIYSNISYSTPALVRGAYETPSDLGNFQSEGSGETQWDAVMDAWEDGDEERALRLAQDFLDSHPDDADAIRRVAYLYFQSGKYDKALELLKSLRKSGQFGDYADFHYAIVLLEIHRKDDAQALLDSISADSDHRFMHEAEQMKHKLSSPLQRLAFQ